MSLKRFLPIVVLAFVAALAVAPSAPAGSIADFDPCPRAANGDLLCPVGTVGTPYSIKFRGDEQPICRPGDDQWYATQGGVPGLSLNTDGTLSGTPTEAGTFSFWLELKLPDHESCSSRDNSEERVTVEIRPGVPVAPPAPKLTIGPEQSSVPVATTGTAFSLAMTANLSDAKTWTIAAGTLPTGLAINASTGVISGTPTALGSFSFTVRAAIADGRSDTKSLTIVVRAPLELTPSEEDVLSEVGVPFELELTPSGGTEQYTWSLNGAGLPAGLTFEDGVISGRPTLAGTFTFTVILKDTEGRTTTYRGRLTVEPRLTIPRQRVKTASVGKAFRHDLTEAGGAGEVEWRIKRGPLPRGIRFDRTTGTFYGKPKKAGTWRVLVEVVDELGVKSTATVTLVVKPAAKR